MSPTSFEHLWLPKHIRFFLYIYIFKLQINIVSWYVDAYSLTNYQCEISLVQLTIFLSNIIKSIWKLTMCHLHHSSIYNYHKAHTLCFVYIYLQATNKDNKLIRRRLLYASKLSMWNFVHTTNNFPLEYN